MDIGSLKGRLGVHSIPVILARSPKHLRSIAPAGVDNWRLSYNALPDFVQSSRPWSQQRVPVPRQLQWALWSLVPIELFWAVWLATIVTGATACRGSVCTVATLDHNAAVLLACGVFSATALVGLIPSTRGFSRCNGVEVIGLALASVAGGASLLGVAALILASLVVLIILAIFVLAFTATSRREIHDARPRTPFPLVPARSANRSRAHPFERAD
jgi:hypothetical protein